MGSSSVEWVFDDAALSSLKTAGNDIVMLLAGRCSDDELRHELARE